MEPDSGLPELRAVERVLRHTTETLARELSRASTTAPDWNAFQWQIALAVAVMHGVTPLLSSTLRWRGPATWQQFLSAQRDHTIVRQRRIVEVLARIDAAARIEQVAILPLKGVALHELGIYQAGERPMADIDLLVQPRDDAAATRVLAMLGYRETGNTGRERIFEPTGPAAPADWCEQGDSPVKIELHDRIAEPLPIATVDITARLLPEPALPGVNPYPSEAALMLHLLLHAAGNIRTRALRLLQLHDISRLASRLSREDWERVLLPRGAPPSWWAYPPLLLTARYQLSGIPAPILARARALCPWPLRRVCEQQKLADVSLSNIWTEAFPGIEWSGSILEALHYVYRRLVPNRVQQVRRRLSAAQDWAVHSPWMRQSQARRMLQWIISGHARAPTVAAVRAATARTAIHMTAAHDRGTDG
jgi:hypothetical protein